MDRLVSVNSLERYAVVLENGHSEHTDGSLDREFLDLKTPDSFCRDGEEKIYD